jgi:hypothetical protein
MLRLILVISVVSAAAQADERELVREAMHTYYRGEFRSGVIPFVLAGASTGGTGGVLVATLLGLGVLEVVVGVIFAVRTAPQRERLDLLLDSSPAEFVRSEREHMHRIVDRFQPILLVAEAVLTVVGAAMAGLGAKFGRPVTEGLGIGLGIHGLALFGIDWAVLDRAQAYQAVLDRWSP